MKSLELRDGRFHTNEKGLCNRLSFLFNKKGEQKMKNEQNKTKTMDINQRKQELFRLLATHERCTFAYLADALEVSKRTVKRYLDELEQYRAIGTVEELQKAKAQYDDINAVAMTSQNCWAFMS